MIGLKSSSAFISALLLLIPLTAHSEVSTQVRCFHSLEGKNINFEFRTYYDVAAKWSGASVRYSKSKQAIALVYHRTEEYVMTEDGPYEFTTTWVEVSDAAVTGQYVIATQGARVNSMRYTNYKSGKQYSFDEDFSIEASPETGCQWE
ncbi:hypothetical protein BK671_14270 [Pseudomonas fluorescens]|uniref:Lipoprotein n=1 Tax=Pseudomonas fluorescens TaxID=294 RepID=A0A423LIE4_PSEFL|nr:hypothetical protein BK671_14270 [Pseudomonas fluorescens]